MNTAVVASLPMPQEDALDAVVRKVAWRLIPILFVAYVINFVDRVNISFAKETMGIALGLDDVSFGIGAGMFFIGYFIFEVPSNMILERIGARRWVPVIMLAWGIATAALAFVTTPLQFYVIRFFIGFAEAGFFPGIVLFMTYWFPASHRGRMMAIFMTALALSGVIGGPICGAVLEFMGGVGKLEGWSWLMIATGLPAAVVGVAIYLLISDGPDQAPWLSEGEQKLLRQSIGHTEKPKASLKAGLSSFWTWNSAWLYFLLVCGGYGISFWMPTLLRGTGITSAVDIGLLVAVPNLVGAIAMILVSRHSDHTRERRWHLTACFALGALGYAITAFSLDSTPLAVLGLSIGMAGLLPSVPLSWTVPTSMLSPSAAAVGIAVIASVGNLGGFFAPVVIGKLSVMTGGLSAGLLVITGLLVLGTVWSASSLKKLAR